MPILYISYDGMLEPLGQSQVISYLNLLSDKHKIYLISFEKQIDLVNTNDFISLKNSLAESDIVWYPMKYHKWPSIFATAWDIFCGLILGFILILTYKIKIIHARSYVSALIAYYLKLCFGVKFIFDMRGFWADEKVDGGSWKRSGFLYKITKYFEKKFILSADHIVTLTNASVRELNKFPYVNINSLFITVIPTCADLKKFSPIKVKNSNINNNNFTLGYVGSVGTYYMFDEVIKCFSIFLKINKNSHFLIINHKQHEIIKDKLFAAGIPDRAFELIESKHSEMPLHLSRMNAGIFFIKPVFSKQASAPTKLAEFLGCGIPCLTNSGVGDIDELLEIEGVGVTISSFVASSINSDIVRFLNLVKEPLTSLRCIDAAQRHFDLKKGVEKYNSIYKSLSTKI